MFLRARPLIAAAACLLAAAAAVRAAAPTPSITDISTGSVNVSLAGGTSPFIAALSTSPAFDTLIDSGTLAGTTTAYPGLDPDTTYYFKAQSAGEASYSSTLSTATLVVTPSALFSLPVYFTADSSFTATARLGWETGGNPEWTSYDLEYDKTGAFSSPSQALLSYPPVTVSGLEANTTYYFRVRARGVSGTLTSFTSSISTATLALSLPDLSHAVHETSATVSWSTVSNGSVQALSSEGYRLKLSGSVLLSSLIDDWSSPDPDVSSRTVTALNRNTTYYYKAGAVNWPGTPNLSGLRNFTTLSAPPQSLSRISVDDGSATLGWTAMGTGEALAYRLEASTESFATEGVYESSATYDLTLSTLTISTLYPNTTYYFRAAALNNDNVPNYSSVISSITMALPVSAGLTYTRALPQSIIVNFTPLPQSPQAFACEGYVLQASTTNFSGGTVFSSATYTYQAGQRSLTVDGLSPNNTYYLRLATLNWEDTPNYSVLSSTRTGFPGPLTGVALADIWSSSAPVTFTPGTAAEGHVAEASVYRFFTGAIISSATSDGSASGLIVTGLDPNTTYYFRAGALYNGATIYTNTSPTYRQTLPQALTGLAFPGVYQSSAAVSWTPLAGVPQSADAEGYLLEASTDPVFGGTLFSSATPNISLDRLTVTDLSPNASYYFRAGTVNLEGGVHYAVTPATSTMANPPVESGFSITSLTVNLRWDTNSNPSDTLYLVEMDDDPAYGSPETSSTTLISSATFSGLTPNTTYYSRVTSINRLSRRTPAVDFSPTATGAYDPVPASPSGIGVSSMTLNWGRGSNLPDVTWYLAKISSNTDFSGTVQSSSTLSLSATFYGLRSDTSYYMSVSALNLTGVPTDPAVSLDTALTLPATAYVLTQAQTFTNMLTDGFTVNWEPNGNSSYTVYYVQISSRSDYSVINSSQLVQGLSCLISGLPMDTTYWARLRSHGQAGDQTDFVEAGSTSTLITANMNAVAQEDNIITLETSYGQISVRIPPGAIGGSTRLTLTPSTSTLPAASSSVSELTPTGIGISLEYFPATLVLGAISVTIPYRLADLPGGIDRSRLILALYDDVNSVWVPLPSVSDTANNRVTGQTWHLSTFQIMQSNPAASLGAAKIYPNPYRPNSVTDVMHFANLPPYAKVKIYTFLGELVRSLKADVNGMAHWDGTNDSGRKTASGVYIAFIQTRDRSASRSFKVALER